MEYSEKIKAKKVFIDKIIIVILHTYILSIPFSTGLCRFLPVVAFLLWFFSSYYMGLKNLLKEYPLFKYIGIFVLYIIFSLMWSDSLHDGFKEIEDYLYWVVLVVFATVVSKENYKQFLLSFIISSLFSLLIAYGIMFEILEPINKFPIYWFLDSIDYSIFLALASMATFYFILFAKQTFLKKIIFVLLFFILINMLFFSDGRTGQYGFFIAFMYLLINYFELSLKSKFTAATIFIIFISLILILNTSAYNRLMMGISDIQKGISTKYFNTSLGVRYITAKIAFDSSLDQPVLGHGIGDDYAEYIEKINTDYSEYSSFLLRENRYMNYRPHSQYMFVSYRLGAIGLILFILILYKMYRLEIDSVSYAKIFRSILIILIFSMLFNNVLKSTLTTAMFLVFIGIAIGLSKKSLEKQF